MAAWKRIAIAVLFAHALVVPFSPGIAQAPGQPRTEGFDAEAVKAGTRQVIALLNAGDFSAALAVGERTKNLAATVHGPDAIETAVSWHNLGVAASRLRRDDVALTALERALSIYERTLPAIHDDTRNVVGELGQVYARADRNRDIADLYARLVARAGVEGNTQHVNMAHILANQGFVLRSVGQIEGSEAAFTRAIEIYENNGVLTGNAFLVTFEALLDRLDRTGRQSLAEERTRRILQRLPSSVPDGRAMTVLLNNRLSQMMLEVGRHTDARAYAEAALVMAESGELRWPAGRLDAKVSALNNLARANRALGNVSAAEQAYRRAIDILKAQNDKPNLGILTDNLAVLLMQEGRLDEAEAAFRVSYPLLESALGTNSPSVGRSAGNLGTLLYESARYAEAEALLRRALAIADAQPVKDDVGRGVVEDNLAGVLRVTGRHAEARPHLERALALFQGALPRNHPRVATAYNNMGRFLLDIGDLAGAELNLATALALSEEIYGATSSHTAIAASNLAETFTAQQRYGEARAYFKRALDALASVYGESHVRLLLTLNAASQLELAAGQPGAARLLLERAVNIELAKQRRVGVKAPATTGAAESRQVFFGLLDALWREADDPSKRDAERALDIMQSAAASPAAVALAAFGARAGAQDAALSALTRERQDLSAEWTAADQRLTKSLGAANRDLVMETSLRNRLSAIDSRVTTIDAELRLRFPRYHDLARPSALTTTELRQYLKPHEVTIQALVTDRETHVIAVTGTDLRWYRVPVGASDLRSIVRTLRCGLDRTEWDGDGGVRCTALLGLKPGTQPGPSDALPFDIETAHRLYRMLFEPAADLIKDRELLFVPTGPLTALPPQILVVDTTRSPKVEHSRLLTDGAQLATVPWLGRRTAVTILPSLGSLKSLRQLAKASRAPRPFLGVGNPLLLGPDGIDRRAYEAPACRMPLSQAASVQLASRSSTVAIRPTRNTRQRTTRSITDTEELRRQWPLPETVDELCRVASHAGATPADVLTGIDATETNIKALAQSGRLGETRILHFATHGLLAGETALFAPQLNEPSLMLTPPATPTDEDDGLLTASEIASLQLDAEWVVLSACNTAGGEDVGAEELSGLARAFMYAGARSLLVSHWAVDSNATVRLVTNVFDTLSRDPKASHGQALARAMESLIQGGDRDSHPAHWSPFIVVGGNAKD